MVFLSRLFPLFVTLLKVASFSASLAGLIYILVNPDKYQVVSCLVDPFFLNFLLLSPAIIPLLDLLKLLPKKLWVNLLRILPSLYFSSLLFKMFSADYRMQDYVVNRGKYFSIRRIWSEEEKLSWIQEQLASTPFSIQSADFAGLAKGSSSLAELKLNYSSFLLQLQQQQQKAESRGFFSTVYQLCVDHPFLFVGGTVAISAMVIGYLIYTRPTPDRIWQEHLDMARVLLDNTAKMLLEAKGLFQKVAQLDGRVGGIDGRLVKVDGRVGAIEVSMPGIDEAIRTNTQHINLLLEQLVAILALKEIGQNELYTSLLVQFLKLLAENEQSLDRLQNLLDSPFHQHLKK